MENTLAQEILAAGKNYREEKKEILPPFSGYRRYLNDGNRVVFETFYFAKRRQLAVLALDYELEPLPEKLPLLEEVIWQVLNEYTWALPAHLPQKNGEFTLEAPYCLDLFSAETGETLAEIYATLKEDLDPFLGERLVATVKDRILTNFQSQPWDWEEKENNWSAVIGGCVGLTALYLLEKNSPEQLAITKRLEKAMGSYLSGFFADGACLEGVGYWSYGFGYFCYYVEKLAEVQGDTHYLELEKVRHIAEFPYHTALSKTKFLPFSDANNGLCPSGLLSFCREKFKVKIPYVADYSPLDFDSCYRFSQLKRNLFWTKPADFKQELAEDSYFYPEAQWQTFRSLKNDLVFAAKGGNNLESHNHNDIGHFIFGTSETLFLTDLGAGEYTKDYFQEKYRYTYLVNSAESHSIPQINQQLQIAGDYFANVLKQEDHQDKILLALDLTPAYPKSYGLKNLTRQFILEKNQQILELSDTFTFVKNKNQVVENFVSPILPRVKGNKIYFITEGKSCVLEMNTNTIQIQEKTYYDHEVNLQTVYLIQGIYESDTETISVEVKISLS